LLKLGGQTARKQEKGKGWTYCLLGMYDGEYDQSKDHLVNDAKSYKLFEMQQCLDFYWMVTVYCNENPIPAFRVYQAIEYGSLGQVSDNNESKVRI
jgi:hypothetical protein